MQAATWLYPWDLLDGGPVEVLREIAGLGLDGVHLATTYHTVQAVLPHNPRRRTFLGERGALYFAPRRELWRDCPLEPLVSPLVAEQGDALAAARPLCRELGLRLVSWTVCLHNADLGYRHPEANVVNLRGEPYRHSLCAANPAVRAYLHALVRELRDRVDAIELESPHWQPFPHHHHSKLGTPYGAAAQTLLTLCFCAHCWERLNGAGVDPERLTRGLAARLDTVLAARPGGDDAEQVAALVAAEPDLGYLLAVREEVVTSLVTSLAAEAGDTPVQPMAGGAPWLTGARPAALAGVAGRLTVLAYGAATRVRVVVEAALAEVGEPARLHVGLSLLHPDTPDRATLAEVVRVVRDAGVTSVGFYNYGLAPAAHLRWLPTVLVGR